MSGLRVLRIATGIAIEVEEEGYLNRRATAASVAMPGTVSGATALNVGIDRVIAIRYRARNYFADFRQDWRNLISACSWGGVDEIAAVRVRRSDLSVGAGVFVGGLGVIRIAEALIKGLQSSDFRIRRRPTRAPV